MTEEYYLNVGIGNEKYRVTLELFDSGEVRGDTAVDFTVEVVQDGMGNDVTDDHGLVDKIKSMIYADKNLLYSLSKHYDTALKESRDRDMDVGADYSRMSTQEVVNIFKK